jgi:hypothetical protein
MFQFFSKPSSEGQSTINLLCSHEAYLVTEPNHPSNVAACHPTYSNRHKLHPAASRPVAVNFKSLHQRLKICLPLVVPVRLSPFQPRLIAWPTCEHRLVKHEKSKISAHTYPCRFSELMSVYLDYRAVYTDMYSIGRLFRPSSTKNRCFPTDYTALRAWLQQKSYTAYRALLCIRCQTWQSHFLCTNSLEILTLTPNISKAWKFFVLCWVVGHTGLPGSEAADATVNVAAAYGILASEGALVCDICDHLRHAILSSWQDECTATQNDKLQVVKQLSRCGSALLQFHQESGSPPCTPQDWAHSPDAWSLVTRWPGISL